MSNDLPHKNKIQMSNKICYFGNPRRKAKRPCNKLIRRKLKQEIKEYNEK